MTERTPKHAGNAEKNRRGVSNRQNPTGKTGWTSPDFMGLDISGKHMYKKSAFLYMLRIICIENRVSFTYDVPNHTT